MAEMSSIRKQITPSPGNNNADRMDCVRNCPVHAFSVSEGSIKINHDLCVHCGQCLPYLIRELSRTSHDLDDSQRKLNSTQEILHRSERLANLAHLTTSLASRVNNPLSVILLYVNLMLEEYKSDPDLQNDLKILATHTDKCKQSVNDLLALSRRNKIIRETVDVCDLVDRTLMTLPPSKHISVNVIHESDDPVADLDSEQIVYVLTNLISNAYNAIQSKGEVTIRTTTTENHIVFTISDTGIGINPEHMNRIFDPFFTTNKIGIDSGLGLAVSNRIVNMHGGTVKVESNHYPADGPTGTTFTVSLPRQISAE
jgi:signal transduction histidine kinase